MIKLEDVKFPIHSNIPESLRGRIPFSRLVPPMRVPGSLNRHAYLDEYRRRIEARWDAEVSARAGEVIDVDRLPITFRHNCGKPTSPSRCPRCEQDSGEKPQVYAVHVDVERNVIPLTQVEKLVPGRKHKRGRWQSEAQHERIKKKWERLFPDQKVLVNKREIARYSMTQLVARWIHEREHSNVYRDITRTHLDDGFDDITAASLGIPE